MPTLNINNDDIRLNSSSSDKVVVNGNLGVGTTSPTYKLHLVGGSEYIDGGLGQINSSPYTSANRLIFNNDYNDVARGPNKITLYDGSWLGGFGVHNNTLAYYSGGIHNWYLASNATNAVSLMTLTSGGSLGIGTTSPSYKLDVAGGDVRFVAAASTDALVRIIAANYATEYDARLFLGENDTNGMTIEYDGSNNVGFIGMNSSTDPTGAYSKRIRMSRDGSEVSFPVGNVGIGTTSPTKKLHVVSSDNEGIFMEGSANGGHWFDFKSANSNLWSMGAQPGLMGWYNRTDSSYKMVITDGGNVGIGTTSPSYKLQAEITDATAYSPTNTLSAAPIFWAYNSNATAGVAATIRLDGGQSGGNGAATISSVHVGSGSSAITFGTRNSSSNVTERVRIDNTGNVGIGTTAPEGKLHVSGGQVVLKGGSTTDQQIVYNFAREYVNGIYNSSGHFRLQDNSLGGTVYQWDGSSFCFPNGNVGIGTTSPTAKLRVQSSGSSFTTPDNNDVAALSIYNSNNSSTNAHAVISLRTQISGGNPFISFDVENETGYSVGMDNSSNQFRIAWAWNSLTAYPAISITPATSPNVLIGTTTDSGYKLRVNGNSYFDGLAHFGQTATSGSAFRWGSYGTAVSSDTMLCMNQLWNGSGWTILNSGMGTTYLNLGDSSASPTIQFGTGPANTAATTKVIILNNGNVGINTTNPSAKLHIAGVGAYNTGIIADGNSANGVGLALRNDNGHHWYLISTGTGNGGGANNLGFYNDTVGAYQVYFTGSGNVGIGTTSPSEKLHVDGNVIVTYNNSFQGINSIGNKAILARVSPTTGIINYAEYATAANLNGFVLGSDDARVKGDIATDSLDFITNTSSRMFINSSGNVGIGTTSPTLGLHVADGKGFIVGPSGASASVYVSPSDENTINGGYGIAADTADIWLNYRGYQDGFSYFRDTRIGNGKGTAIVMVDGSEATVGIGTTSPSYKLDVVGDVRITSGSLGVGVAPNATDGRVDASNDIVAYSTSDQRLKENVTPIENALEKVKTLTGVEFDWKEETAHIHGYHGHDVGIIAQDVQAVLPEAVRTNESGYLSVRYEKMIALLIEANKELAARVEILEQKLKQ